MSCETFLSSLSVTWPVLPCGLARPGTVQGLFPVRRPLGPWLAQGRVQEGVGARAEARFIPVEKKGARAQAPGAGVRGLPLAGPGCHRLLRAWSRIAGAFLGEKRKGASGR